MTHKLSNVPSWPEYFTEMAQLVSTKSKDASTKVGAVLVGTNKDIRSTGFNGFPIGVNEGIPERHERPTKYLYTEHAERNAIFLAARRGTSTEGCTLYMNYWPLPCCDCTRALIQAGIRKIVGMDIPFPGKGVQWQEHMRESLSMLNEAGVELFIVVEGEETIFGGWRVWEQLGMTSTSST